MKRFFVIIDGPMGAGKTSVARFLHKKLRRTALLGSDKIKWFVSDFKRSKKDNEITHEVVLAMCKEYLRQGINILLDHGFKKGEMMIPYIELAKNWKTPLLIYQLEASHETLLKRLKMRPKPSSAKTKVSRKRILNNIAGYFKNKYKKAKIIDTSKRTPQQIASIIIKDINAR